MPIVINGVTYLGMGDSIVAANLLGLPSYITAFAGYGNGTWADAAAISAEHPGAPILDFSVFLTDTGNAGDFEPGDMAAADFVPYVTERLAAGVWRPVCYASIEGEMIQGIANLIAAGISLSKVRLLSAHYGAGQHICGPTTCKLGAAATYQMDGTQWIDHGTWDESLLNINFFGAPAPSPTPPPPAPTPQEDIMGMTDFEPFFGAYHVVEVDSNGNLWHKREVIGAVITNQGLSVPGVKFAGVPRLTLVPTATGGTLFLHVDTQNAEGVYRWTTTDGITWAAPFRLP